MAGVLDGVTVVELAGIGPAPFAAMMLADHGARVIRIERPGTDDAGAANRDILSRNREFLALDLKSPEGIARVIALAEQADALIEGFRPGVLERLGLGPDVLLAANPRLVIGRMTGFGQSGPTNPPMCPSPPVWSMMPRPRHRASIPRAKPLRPSPM